MKKIWTLLLFCNFLCATPLQDRSINPRALSELATKLGIPEGKDLVQETQREWIRKPGQERWEMTEINPESRLFVLKWAEDNGLTLAWRPSKDVYDKALILGATTSTMQKRLNYLKQLWEEGVRFQEIVWLTGDRPLDQRVDGLTERCKTESEAAHIIWEESDLPQEMRKIATLFVASPMKSDGKRPNTEDTLIAWLKSAPHSCTALFVSNQPFCGYQYAVVNAKLPKTILFDVVGPGADPSKNPLGAAGILDSVARWIYMESLHKAAKAVQLEKCLQENYHIDPHTSAKIAEKFSLIEGSHAYHRIVDTFIEESEKLNLNLQQAGATPRPTETPFHSILFENETLRVSWAVTKSGEQEPPTTHPWKSIMVVIKPSQFYSVRGDGAAFEDHWPIGVYVLDPSEDVWSCKNVGQSEYNGLVFEIKTTHAAL